MQATDPMTLVNVTYGGDEVNGLTRLELGLAIDEIGISHYPQVILLAAVKLVMESHYSNSGPIWIEKLANQMRLSQFRQDDMRTSSEYAQESLEEFQILDEQLKNVLIKVNAVVDVIKTLELDDNLWPLVPVIDGHELLQVSIFFSLHAIYCC